MKRVGESSVAEVRASLREADAADLPALIRRHAPDPRSGVRDAVAAARRRVESHQAEDSRLASLYRMESELRGTGTFAVAGVDEVGRGALAGPLTAGACILASTPRIAGLDDSKRLSPARRSELAEVIRDSAISFAVSHVPACEVDRVGVTAALVIAMQSALAMLRVKPDHVIVDGRPIGLHPAETAVVGGDRLVAAVAAASIVAKVERDRLMCELALRYPEYLFEENKGYGTQAHFAAIDRFGLTEEHRVSFCHASGTDRLF